MACGSDSWQSQEMAYGIEGGGEPLFFFYDCETTGLSVRHDCIIEIAAVVYTKGLRLRIPHTNFSSLCYTDRELSEKTVELTGLTNHDLVGEPCLRDVLHRFFDWLHETVRRVGEKERKVYVPVLAAHSGPRLDFPMLFRAVERLGVEDESLRAKFDGLNIHYADTFSVFKKLQSSRKYGPCLRKLGAQDIYLAFFPPLEGAHRALNDAEDMCRIFSESPPADLFMEKLRTYVQTRRGMEIVKEQTRKFLDIKCRGESFFKVYQVIDLLHNGITFEDVEVEYRESKRHFRRFLERECGVVKREDQGVIISGLHKLSLD